MVHYFIIVIDIGKTNKKIGVYTDHLECIDTVKEKIEEITIDGIIYEDILSIKSFLFSHLATFLQKYGSKVAIISITTHGACWALVDKAGELGCPITSYTNPMSESLQRDFFTLAGVTKEELHKTTATPPFDCLICQAKSIYFSQRLFGHDVFRKARAILSFPQYLGFLLTGNLGVEPTMLGCHTYLLDFMNVGDKLKYSNLAETLDILHLLPEPNKYKSFETLGPLLDTFGSACSSTPPLVTLGVHDSNASLLPYLIKKGTSQFSLVSTGTWCVIMRPLPPNTKPHLTDNELGKIIFYNLDVLGRPVKTANFAIGIEFNKWLDFLPKEAAAAEDDDDSAFPIETYREIIKAREWFILPEIMTGCGQFPGSPARLHQKHKGDIFFDDISSDMILFPGKSPAFARGVLYLSLAIQTVFTLQQVGHQPGDDIYVEGGFSNNRDYLQLLASLLPTSCLYISNLSEATSFGAALLGKMAFDNFKDVGDPAIVNSFEIGEVKIPPLFITKAFPHYVDSFFSFLNSSSAFLK